MQEAIFQTVWQALHLSFLIMSLEARQKNALRMALIQIMEAIEHPTAKQSAWLDQLRGTGGGTVNFAGLDPYEVRAQCAMVTQAVRDHLPPPEKFAIWTRFGTQTERAAGVAGLADYMKPHLNFGDEIAIRALVYGHSVPGMRQKGLSYPEIAKERGINARTLRRGAAVIASTCRILESMAVERLRPMFERDGLVECVDQSKRAA